MYSPYKLNKHGDNLQPWCIPFPILNQSVIPCKVLTVASWPAYMFLMRQEKKERKWSHSVVSDSMTPWTVAHQAPPSMEFSRQEYWSGLSFPSPGDLPDPGIKPRSPTLQADTLPSEPPGKLQETGKVIWYYQLFKNLLQFVVIHSQRLSHSQWNKRCFSGITLLSPSSNKSWQFDL